jgi:hypothetical protein
MIDEKQVADLLRDAQYKFAKTLRHNPHFYTLRETWAEPSLFIECAQFIQKNGRPEQFGGKIYYQFYANGFKYWIMDHDPAKAVLINRKPENVH